MVISAYGHSGVALTQRECFLDGFQRERIYYHYHLHHALCSWLVRIDS